MDLHFTTNHFTTKSPLCQTLFKINGILKVNEGRNGDPYFMTDVMRYAIFKGFTVWKLWIHLLEIFK